MGREGVPLAPHRDGPLVTDATRRALARAGYTLEDESAEKKGSAGRGAR